MKNLNNITTTREAKSFARDNGYNKTICTQAYNFFHSKWVTAMTIIHSNGKNGDYQSAKEYKDLADTFKVWA